MIYLTDWQTDWVSLLKEIHQEKMQKSIGNELKPFFLINWYYYLNSMNGKAEMKAF